MAKYPVDEVLNQPGVLNVLGGSPVAGHVLHRAANEVSDRLAAAAAQAGCQHPWPGPGEQPAKFMCRCGTLVYRSYADYCDD